jgi:hypothetical protein
MKIIFALKKYATTNKLRRTRLDLISASKNIKNKCKNMKYNFMTRNV